MPAKITQVAPEVRNIRAPAPICDIPAWLVWNAEKYPNEEKPRKVPYVAAGGRRRGEQGSPEDLAKLVTFSQAVDAAAKRGMTGVGLALLPGCGIVAVDFDNCVTGGVVDPEVLSIVTHTYAEFSPSGLGVRAFFKGDLGNRKAATTASTFGFEVFSTNGFCTVTGNALPHVDILGYENRVAPVTPELEALCEKRFGQRHDNTVPDDFTLGHAQPLGLTTEEAQQLLEKLDPDMGRDDWIRVGAALHHETEGGEDGFDLWHDWSAQGAKFVDEEDLRRNWDSFDRRAGTRQQQVTMATVKFMAREAERGQLTAPITPEQASAAAESLLGALEPSERVETPPGYEGRFPIYHAATLARQPSTEWLIKGVLPAADLCVLYGASGSGKSFVALHMAAAIALGRPWRGRKTRKGRVVIIAAEGGGGYGKRIKALAHQLGIDPAAIDIGVMTAPPDLMKQEDITELVAAIKASGGADLIQIDTLAQVTPGANENSGEDMGLAIKHCRTLREATGATIMPIHHAGKDLHRGSRGWSGIRAAADTEIEVTRDEETGERGIRVTKQKDGEDGLAFGFKLNTVLVGMDPDGDDETSCVVEDADPPVKRKRQSNRVYEMGPNEIAIMRVVESLGADEQTLSIAALVNKAYAEMDAPAEGKERSRQVSLSNTIRNMARKAQPPFVIQDGFVIMAE